MKQFRNPENVHVPVGAYTHQIEVSGTNRWLVLSGQIGKNENDVLPEDTVKQLEIAMDNLVRNLHAANMEVKDIVKITLYIVGPVDNAKRREAISKVLGDFNPCMTVIFVSALANPSIKVEVDAWACK